MSNFQYISRHEFITKGYMPKRLPTTALTVQPRLTAEQMSFSNTRKPLIMVQSYGLTENLF